MISPVKHGGFIYMEEKIMNEFEIYHHSDDEFLKNSRVIEGGKYGSFTVTKMKLMNPVPKDKEIIKYDVELISKLRNLVPFKYSNEGRILSGDLFVAGTIPSTNVTFTNVPMTDQKSSDMLTVQIITCDNSDVILNDLKNNDNSMVGIVRIKWNFSEKETHSFDLALRIQKSLAIDWYPIISLPEYIYNINISNELMELMDCLIHYRDQLLIAWYGLQIALLNPVIKERIHRTTVPVDDVKVDKKTKKRKTIKRYVKTISIDDMSDISIGDPKHHNMTQSYWWVTGHWRNQKIKNGHKQMFIKGYWKGPMREVAEELYEPVERQVILE